MWGKSLKEKSLGVRGGQEPGGVNRAERRWDLSREESEGLGMELRWGGEEVSPGRGGLGVAVGREPWVEKGGGRGGEMVRWHLRDWREGKGDGWGCGDDPAATLGTLVRSLSGAQIAGSE